MSANTLLKKQSANFTSDDHCYHCHEAVSSERLTVDDKIFCCEGCRTVYQILNENNLCVFYQLDDAPGLSQKNRKNFAAYDYLDDATVAARIIDFQNGRQTGVRFFLPDMHCASCIWLLENLYKINPAVAHAKVNFLKKEVSLFFDPGSATLREVAVLLAQIGYPPEINLSDLSGDTPRNAAISRRLYLQLGVAGFAFGNIMLLSFPEYLGMKNTADGNFAPVFGFLNLALATPVLLYSAQDYLRSAWQGLRNARLNIDVPLSVGILALFIRSTFEILTKTGSGYMDSFTGLLFFLLAGKWFQQKTFYRLSFERDYKSYFPVSATLKNATDGTERSVSLDKLTAGDVVVVRNGEIIPADGVILKGAGSIDYAFVTGESEEAAMQSGGQVYAGGRQKGEAVEIVLTKRVSQSYLTRLWQHEAFQKKKQGGHSRLADAAGKYFTIVILAVSLASFLYWIPQDAGKAVNAATAVLIVACPCAVALSIPFTLGNLLRIFGANGFYLKNTNVLEAMEAGDVVVFDKTGTLTNNAKNVVRFFGEDLTDAEKTAVKSVARQSGHPFSRAIFEAIDAPLAEVEAVGEVVGQGVEALTSSGKIKIGSANFVGIPDTGNPSAPQTEGSVYIGINGRTVGYFKIKPAYRTGFADLLTYCKKQGKEVFLLSGDADREGDFLAGFFSREKMFFRRTPMEKLEFVQQLKAKGRKVMMIGDGLNDAGALRLADVGIVISENTNNFSPACDAILSAGRFIDLPRFLALARAGSKIVGAAYFIAFCYNLIGLSYAASAQLQPVVAAILMPLSSATIVAFGVLSGNRAAHKLGIDENHPKI